MPDQNITQNTNSAPPQAAPSSVVPSTVAGSSVANELNPVTGISNQVAPTAPPATGFGLSGGVSTNDISKSMPASVSPTASAPTSGVGGNVSGTNPLPASGSVPQATAVPQNLPVAPVAPTTVQSSLVNQADSHLTNPSLSTAPPPIQASTPAAVPGPAADIQTKSNYSPFIDDEDDSGGSVATPPATASSGANQSVPAAAQQSAPDPVTQPQEPTPPPSADPIKQTDYVPSETVVGQPNFTGESQQQTPRPQKGLIATLVVLGLFIVIAAIVALTEFGIISLGFEKFYGQVGLEKLWGGLSIKSDAGLAQSLVATSVQKDYKVRGTIDLTIDKAKSNEVTDELISKLGASLALVDSRTIIGPTIKAILAVDEEESSDDTGLLDEETTSSDGSASSSSSSSGYDYDSLLNSNSAVSSSSSSSGSNQTDLPAYTSAESSNQKKVSATISAGFSDEGMEADIVASRSVGPASMSLLARDGVIAVKSQTMQFGEDASLTEWNQYKYGPTGDTLADQITAIQPGSETVVVGSRIANEKVDNTRCYRYQINSLEIGAALTSLGIEDDMVQSIRGDVWVEISTKLLKKIDIRVVLSPSMPISQINISLTLYDYGTENEIDQLSGNIISDSSDSADDLYGQTFYSEETYLPEDTYYDELSSEDIYTGESPGDSSE